MLQNYRPNNQIRYTYDNNELRRYQLKTTETYNDQGVWQSTTQSQESTFIADSLTNLSISIINEGTETSKNEISVEATTTVDDEQISRTYRILARPEAS